MINTAKWNYRTLLCLWPVEQLADGPTGCGEVVRRGCLFDRNIQCDKMNCAYVCGKNALEQF